MNDYFLIQATIGTVWFFLTMILHFLDFLNIIKIKNKNTSEKPELFDNIFVTNFVLSFLVSWIGWLCLAAL